MMDPKKARTVRVTDKEANTKGIDSKILIWERRATANFMDRNSHRNDVTVSSPDLQITSPQKRLEHHPTVNYSKTESILGHETIPKKEGDNPKRLNHDECMKIEKELRRLYNFSQIQNDKLKEKLGQINHELREEQEKNKLLLQEIEQLKARISELEKEIVTKKNMSTSPSKENSLPPLDSTESESDNNNGLEPPTDETAAKQKIVNKDLIKIKKQKKASKEKRGFWGSLRIKRPSKTEGSSEQMEAIDEEYTKLRDRPHKEGVSRERSHSISRNDTKHEESPRSKSPEKVKKRHSKEYGVAFGIKRGACNPPCKCTKYSPKTPSGPCDSCGHFPAMHEDLGKIEDNTPGKNMSPPHLRLIQVEPQSGRGDLSARSRGRASTVSSPSPSSPHQEKERHPSPQEIAAATKQTIREKLDQAWLIDYDDLYFIDILGKGTSSVVYKGTFKGQEVAIKVLRLETQIRDLEDFKKELEVLSFLRSPYVVHFLGATLEPKLCMVLEYCPKGSLFQYLHDTKNKLTWSLVLKWITETTKGTNCLHLWKPQIVHRDLKSPNLLIDKDMRIKVCDFGLSRFTNGEHNLATLGKLRGTYAYTAPELYYGTTFTPKSDVYSIGIVLWEMVHRLMCGKHERPFGEYKEIVHDFQVIVKAATKSLRPTIPEKCPESVSNVIRMCWRDKPEERPTCSELLEILENVQKEYEANAEEWEKLAFVSEQSAPTNNTKLSSTTESLGAVVPPNIVSRTVIKMERVASEKSLPPIPPRPRRMNNGSMPGTPSTAPMRIPTPPSRTPTRPRGNSDNASPTQRNTTFLQTDFGSLIVSEPCGIDTEVTDPNNPSNTPSHPGSVSSANLTLSSLSNSVNNTASISPLSSQSPTTNKQPQLPAITEEAQPPGDQINSNVTPQQTQTPTEHFVSEAQMESKKEKRHSSKRHSSKRNSQRRQQPPNSTHKDLAESKESDSKSLSFEKSLTMSDNKLLNK
jgi:tRNA A-37 threonylcarbamoyl transferase component Bud32